MRRIGLVLLLVTLVGAGCSDDDKESTGGATTAKVSVDGRAPFTASFLAYFPNEVRVHPGDTVEFKSVYSGEPHSVSFGTLVTEGLNAADAQMNDPQFDESSIPQLAAIPPMLPEGPGDANQVSAAPCYVTSGNPPGPGATPCPNHSATPPEFTGTESFFSSGFMPNDDVFTVKLADNIAPGTYRYFCTLHTTIQQGKVVVVPDDEAIPTAAENQAAAEQQLQRRVQALQPAVDAANNAPPDKAVAGVASEEAPDSLANVFGAPTLSVPVGGSVNWTLFGPHTISFNVPDDAKRFIARAPDGLVHLNPKALVSAGGGVEQPRPPEGGEEGSGGSTSTTTAATTTTGGGGDGPGGGLPPPTPVDGGSWDGTGFYSSGLYVAFPPELFSYEMRFTKAGSYTYECIIHPGMAGQVKVG